MKIDTENYNVIQFDEETWYECSICGSLIYGFNDMCSGCGTVLSYDMLRMTDLYE